MGFLFRSLFTFLPGAFDVFYPPPHPRPISLSPITYHQHATHPTGPSPNPVSSVTNALFPPTPTITEKILSIFSVLMAHCFVLLFSSLLGLSNFATWSSYP